MMQAWLAWLWPNDLVGTVVFALFGVMLLIWLYVMVNRYWFYRRLRGALMQYATPEALEIALTKHFVVLDVIAANAAWLGLMGTVFSVMLFFGMMSPENKIDAIGLMQVFASALKTTLMGLLLALCVDTSQRVLRRSVHVLMLTWQDMRRLQRGEY